MQCSYQDQESVQALAGMVRIQGRLLKNLMLSHHLHKILPVFAMIKLCLSYNPLLNENFAAVTLTTLCIVSAISKKFELANSCPLFLKKFPGPPY